MTHHYRLIMCVSIGYARFDKPQIVDLLNDLYIHEWNWFVNFFSPSMKLLSSERIGSRKVKKYDNPKTPCQRLRETDEITHETRIRLSILMRTLNPFRLNEIINEKISRILEFVRL